MTKPSPQLAFTIEYVNLEALGIDAWESHQIGFLQESATLTIDNKSRQVGWSFIAAMDALASAILYPNTTCIFLSINQDEANNKIRYLNLFEDALNPKVRLEREVKNRTEIVYTNGSRIKSLPCKSPRGYAQPRIYVDEFAHYPKDDEIYQGLLPAITRGGVVRIGSSPLGARGMFYEIMSQHHKQYNGYVRRNIPWWAVEGLSKDVHTAIKEAPKLTTEERVDRWATPRLMILYENHTLPDFQQEYECAWLDDAVSWIDWDLIKKNQEYFLVNEDEDPVMMTVNEFGIDGAVRAINSLRDQVGGVLFGGVDIGRRQNNTEIMVIEETVSSYPLRLSLSLDNLEFQEQKFILEHILNTLPIDTMLLDESGLGMQLAEDLSNDYPEAIGVPFSQQVKTDIAVKLRLRFEEGKAPIPLDKDMAAQIHSIRKMATTANNIVFRPERTKKHHADKFWALGLAHLASEESTDTIGSVPYSIRSYRGQKYGS